MAAHEGTDAAEHGLDGDGGIIGHQRSEVGLGLVAVLGHLHGHDAIGPEPKPSAQAGHPGWHHVRMRTLEHVCVVHELLPDDGHFGVTAIDKRPVVGPVQVNRLNVRGDVQADRKHHGGRFRAVYVVSDEDAAVIEAELGRPMPVGWMGENFRVSGTGSLSDVVVGERWRIGTAEIAFSEPRIPCATFARYVGERSYVKRFTQLGRPGGMCEVVTPGEVEAGQEIELVHRPAHGLTLGLAFANRYPADIAGAFLAEMPEADITPEVLAKARRSLV